LSIAKSGIAIAAALPRITASGVVKSSGVAVAASDSASLIDSAICAGALSIHSCRINFPVAIGASDIACVSTIAILIVGVSIVTIS